MLSVITDEAARSELTMSLALDGLERILRKKYPHSGPRALKGMNKQVNLVRYADDFIITGISKEVLEHGSQTPRHRFSA